jgi:hypothetical protein
VLQKSQKYFLNDQQQKLTNQTKSETKKNMHICTKHHLGYLRHFEESPQTETDGIYRPLNATKR